MPRQSKAAAQAALEAAGSEYLDLLKAEAALAARKAELQTYFRDQFDLGAHAAGPAKISIQRNVRRDDKAFEAAYPFDRFPDYYRAAIDSAAVKRDLAPAVLERFQVSGDNKVIVSAFEADA